MRVFVLALLVAGCGGSALEVGSSPLAVDGGIDGASKPDAATDAPTSPDVGADAQTLPDTATSTDAPIDAPQDAPDTAWDTGVDSAIDAPIDGPACECEGTITQLHAQVAPKAPPGGTVSATAACDGEVRVNLGATCYSGCSGTTADTCWGEVPIVKSDDGKTFSCSFPYDPKGTHNVLQYYCNSCVAWKSPCH